MITTMPIAMAYPRPGLWRTSPRIWAPMMMVTRLIVPPVSWNAVAWAPKALPNRRMTVPSSDGIRMGRAT
jgi:hypothetical protein